MRLDLARSRLTNCSGGDRPVEGLVLTRHR